MGRSQVDCPDAPLQFHRVQFDLLVSLFDRPQVERRPRNLVHDRHGEAEPREIDGLEIAPAGVAPIDAQVLEDLGPEVAEPALVLFAAERAADASERPSRQARRAEPSACGKRARPENAGAGRSYRSSRGDRLPLAPRLRVRAVVDAHHGDRAGRRANKSAQVAADALRIDNTRVANPVDLMKFEALMGSILAGAVLGNSQIG